MGARHIGSAGVEVKLHSFLTTTLYGSERSASHPGRFTFGEGEGSTHGIGGCVAPRITGEDLEKRKIPCSSHPAPWELHESAYKYVWPR